MTAMGSEAPSYVKSLGCLNLPVPLYCNMARVSAVEHMYIVSWLQWLAFSLLGQLTMLWNLTLYLCTCITYGGPCFWIWLLSSKSFFSLSQCNKSMPTVNPWWKRDFPPPFCLTLHELFFGFSLQCLFPPPFVDPWTNLQGRAVEGTLRRLYSTTHTMQ